jgi:hypothetical protein
MNIMLVTVTERTREIGTRKAIGAKNSDILTQFLVESMVMCGMGGAIGASLGIGLSKLIPMIPGLNDHEMTNIIGEAVKAGAKFAGFVPIRLPYAVAPMFERWLELHFPGRKENVLNRIRSMRGGKLNDPNFGSRMQGQGIFADQLSQMFHIACRKAGLKDEWPGPTTEHFRRPAGPQLELSL